MKLKPKPSSIQQQIFEAEREAYEKMAHEQTAEIEHLGVSAAFYPGVGWALGPKRPTPEMVERAQFVDKTYHWKNAGIRPGERRSSK